jgi:mannose-6-phosphate isomerase-like protein (cupin superfamily)
MPFLDPVDMITGSPLRGWSGRFFHSENMTFAHWDIDPDAADLHEHHHPQEEVWNVIEGEALLVVDGDQRRLGPGQIAIVPPNVSHSVKVVGPCRAIIVDYPIRLDLPGVDRSDRGPAVW